MADEQEQLEDGWQARDLRSGVAKVYHEAKRRNILGLRVAAGWAVGMLVFAVLDMAGVASVANPFWEFAAALVVMLLAALAMSRAPIPMLAASAVILVDLIVVAFRFPELFERGEMVDFVATGVRITLAPAVLSMVLNGYFGALSIQAFKLGFSPGADWRTRINPAMLQFTVVGSCIVALFIGVASWFGAINSGFMQPGALWEPGGGTQSKQQAGQSGEGDGVQPFTKREDLPETEPEYPENAMPIESTAGLDAFTQRAIEEAFEWGVDSDQAECVAEGQGRQDRCRDERCRYWARIFVRACLTKAKRIPNTAMRYPGRSRPMRGSCGRNGFAQGASSRCAASSSTECRGIATRRPKPISLEWASASAKMLAAVRRAAPTSSRRAPRRPPGRRASGAKGAQAGSFVESGTDTRASRRG
jgi:hypothetical protein